MRRYTFKLITASAMTECNSMISFEFYKPRLAPDKTPVLAFNVIYHRLLDHVEIYFVINVNILFHPESVDMSYIFINQYYAQFSGKHFDQCFRYCEKRKEPHILAMMNNVDKPYHVEKRDRSDIEIITDTPYLNSQMSIDMSLISAAAKMT